MEFLKQYTNKLRSMNGTTDSNGMPSQGDQELKQKEERNSVVYVIIYSRIRKKSVFKWNF